MKQQQLCAQKCKEPFFYYGFALIQFQRFTRRLVKLTHSKCESKARSVLISCAGEGNLSVLCAESSYQPTQNTCTGNLWSTHSLPRLPLLLPVWHRSCPPPPLVCASHLFFSHPPLHFCSGGVGNSARQRQPNAYKLPKCQHWAPAPSQASEASQYLHKTHDCSHCSQFTSPQFLAKESPPFKISLSLGPFDLPATISTFLWDLHFTAVVQSLRLGSIMRFVACKALIWMLLIEINNNKKSHQTSTLSTNGFKTKQIKHFFWPKLSVVQKVICYYQHFSERLTFRVWFSVFDWKPPKHPICYFQEFFIGKKKKKSPNFIFSLLFLLHQTSSTHCLIRSDPGVKLFDVGKAKPELLFCFLPRDTLYWSRPPYKNLSNNQSEFKKQKSFLNMTNNRSRWER